MFSFKVGIRPTNVLLRSNEHGFSFVGIYCGLDPN